jgi:hypothetical protein
MEYDSDLAEALGATAESPGAQRFLKAMRRVTAARRVSSVRPFY